MRPDARASPGKIHRYVARILVFNAFLSPHLSSREPLPMHRFRPAVFALLVAAFALSAGPAAAQAQRAPGAYEPEVGQPGKDVVWVPTPQAVVDKMLDMARVTPKDFLMDLGS